ncbi:MAG: hypothetical protein CMN21_21995, partial [Rubinisphaera sp.]|nr:hypothetical protein [Rubinisphaera sp.]
MREQYVKTPSKYPPQISRTLAMHIQYQTLRSPVQCSGNRSRISVPCSFEIRASSINYQF